VSEFVDECRREWRRLGVADPVANEMAADLTADLEEAEAEGGSPEDVLGNSAFDPRRFAAAWAVARGVTGPPVPDRGRMWRPSVAIALTVILAMITVGGGLVLLVGTRGQSFAVAVHRAVVSPPSIRLFGPGPGQFVPRPPFAATQFAGVDFRPLALLLVIVGLVGLGVLAVLYWSRRSDRGHRDGGRQTPSWS
jgi:hypothetical protein